MSFYGKGLYPANQNRGECHEAHGKDIMVDGSCPKKSVPPPERMFASAASQAGKAVGVNPGSRPGGTTCAQNHHPVSVAIPLIKLTSKKVTYLYDLMYAAFDAQPIEETSRKFGHAPIADRNGRGKEVIPMAPHEAERYKIRSCAERANNRLKEDSGACNAMVKGHSKVTLHLMLGVVVLFADQLLRLAG